MGQGCRPTVSHGSGRPSDDPSPQLCSCGPHPVVPGSTLSPDRLEAVRGWVPCCRASGTLAHVQWAGDRAREPRVSNKSHLVLRLLAQTHSPTTLHSEDVCSWAQRLHHAGAGGSLDKLQGTQSKRQALKRLRGRRTLVWLRQGEHQRALLLEGAPCLPPGIPRSSPSVLRPTDSKRPWLGRCGLYSETLVKRDMGSMGALLAWPAALPCLGFW